MIKYILSLLIALIIFARCKDANTPITKNDIRHAEKLIGIRFSGEQIDTLASYLKSNLEGYDSMRLYSLDREVFPALLFDPLPRNLKIRQGPDTLQITPYEPIPLPEPLDMLCLYSVAELGYLIKHKKITSEQLTRFYIARINKYDPTLKSVITLTEDLALEQAHRADRELNQGIYRGPLHGIPYGLKDLMAVKGYPTTWGAMPYREQSIQYSATVANKLEAAGAVLIAKLTSGALARGDVWFDGRTVSPWDTLMGASGSSAGSGSATAAGLVAFSIGTETLGSIISPSARNGVTGLRPTYGTVSRHGVMTLSWSMDKVGPICRTAEDCAIIYSIIHGQDTLDPSTYQSSFRYTPLADLLKLRVGVLKSDVENDTTSGAKNLKHALTILDSMGIKTIEKILPKNFPFKVFDIILRSESGAFFDELVRSNDVDQMVQQDKESRANSLRQSRFIPAVEYIQANRHRTVLIEKMNELMQDIDVLISPTSAKNQSLITNLTGLPALSIPTGLDSLNHPTSMTLIAPLFGEGKLLEFGNAFQQATHHHKMIPTLFKNK